MQRRMGMGMRKKKKKKKLGGIGLNMWFRDEIEVSLAEMEEKRDKDKDIVFGLRMGYCDGKWHRGSFASPCCFPLLPFSSSSSSSFTYIYFVVSFTSFLCHLATMAKIQLAVALKTLFSLLGALMLATLLYTLITDGLPFRIDLLTPWLAATLIDLCINIATLAVWVSYKESNWIASILWIVLFFCLGSIATCAYIVVQFLKLSSQESSQDPMYYVLLRHPNKIGTEPKRKNSFVVLFGILGVFMLGTVLYTLVTDGLPFRMELLTPWMAATLVDFYINVTAIAVWVAYKESSWISAVLWIILLIALGSITTCTYVVWQLLQISSEDPAYLILVHQGDRAESKYKELPDEAT